MSRTWIIDGRAINSARWRTVVHDALKDERVFYRDLNMEWNGDGTVNAQLRRNEDGSLERCDDEEYLVDERDKLYETNRGAAAGVPLGMDPDDMDVLATFELPVDVRLSRFDSLYCSAVRGNGDSLLQSWQMIPDTAKLIYTLHLWERFQKGKLHPAVWGATLFMAWPHGKVGSMLFRADLHEREVVRMFEVAPKERLMPEEDAEIFDNFPKQVTAYRGTSSLARYQQRGFSWTLSPRQAQWFAYANTARGEPMVMEALIQRRGILMYSSFEEELVVNPMVPCVGVTYHHLDNRCRETRLPALRRLIRYIAKQKQDGNTDSDSQWVQERAGNQAIGRHESDLSIVANATGPM